MPYALQWILLYAAPLIFALLAGRVLSLFRDRVVTAMAIIAALYIPWAWVIRGLPDDGASISLALLMIFLMFVVQAGAGMLFVPKVRNPMLFEDPDQRQGRQSPEHLAGRTP